MYERNSCPLVAFFAALSAVALAVPAEGGVISQSSDIPPTLGRFTSEAEAEFSTGFTVIRLKNIQFTVLDDPAPMRTVVGLDEQVAFNAALTADFFFFDDVGQTEEGQLTLSGPAEMLVSGKAGQDVGTFQTEIVSLDLMGDAGGVAGLLQLQQSPTQPSLGQATVLPYQPPVFPDAFEIDGTMDLVVTSPGLVGGDVTIPLSLDAIVPEPHSLSLVAAAAAGLLIRAKVRFRRRPPRESC
jgi:hypothetical protein